MAIVKSRTEVRVYALAVAASAALLIAAYAHRTPFSSQEAWGFVTGGWCVWLQVKENIWAWPISLVNNAVFFFLFQRERLFGDMGLQAAYFTLGAYGWYTWLFGGQAHTHAKGGAVLGAAAGDSFAGDGGRHHAPDDLSAEH
jgi:nicotinamide riboside transporter PnuC